MPSPLQAQHIPLNSLYCLSFVHFGFKDPNSYLYFLHKWYFVLQRPSTIPLYPLAHLASFLKPASHSILIPKHPNVMPFSCSAHMSLQHTPKLCRTIVFEEEAFQNLRTSTTNSLKNVFVTPVMKLYCVVLFIGTFACIKNKTMQLCQNNAPANQILVFSMSMLHS